MCIYQNETAIINFEPLLLYTILNVYELINLNQFKFITCRQGVDAYFHNNHAVFHTSFNKIETL